MGGPGFREALGLGFRVRPWVPGFLQSYGVVRGYLELHGQS